LGDGVLLALASPDAVLTEPLLHRAYGIAFARRTALLPDSVLVARPHVGT